MTTKALPDLPSELLRVALDDLAKVEADPRYIVDMGIWHYQYPEGECAVCLAGAVIAETLAVQPDEIFSLDSFGYDIGRKFCAIDHFRIGLINCGLEELGMEAPDGIPRIIEITPYHKDATAFRRDMEGMITLLKEHGL